MRLLLLLLAIPLPLAAQQSELFPRLSVTGGWSPASFRTDARIDPQTTAEEGTRIGLERDLGLPQSRTLQRFSAQWRPLRRHELAAAYFSARRNGLEQIRRDITFRNQTYPVDALVTTRFDLDYASLTYTYWARRAERDGFGITLGAAALSMKASVAAEEAGVSASVAQQAKSEVPVALAGLQGRWSVTSRLHAEASAATLPRVTVGDYSGNALTAAARLEYRAARWLGVGAAYHYFRLAVDVAQPSLRGALDMTIRGPEAYLRFGW